MMNRDEITAAAKAAPAKVNLEEYREAVQTLREKGYTWREVADFLNERGISTDHTRVYRLFGAPKRERRSTTRPVEVSRVKFTEERLTRKKNNAWTVLEIEMPGKSGTSIVCAGYVWKSGAVKYQLGPDQLVSIREPILVTKSSKNGFPSALIKAEFEIEDGSWAPQEVYLVPDWEALI